MRLLQERALQRRSNESNPTTYMGLAQSKPLMGIGIGLKKRQVFGRGSTHIMLWGIASLDLYELVFIAALLFRLTELGNFKKITQRVRFQFVKSHVPKKGSHQSEKILTSTKGIEAISKERLINRLSWRRDLLTWRSDIATLDSIRTRLQHSGHIKIDEVVTTYSTVKISCIGLLMFCYIFYPKQTRFQR